MRAPARPLAPHYAWLVVAIVFFVLLVAASVRAAPGVLIIPFETEFGWDRASISLAVAVSFLVNGLGAVLGGALVDRLGARRTALVGTASLVLGLVPMVAMRELWQLHLLWGVVIGVGSGTVGGVLAAAIAHRWFAAHRGLVMGLFGAAGSAGQLVLIPAMMSLVVSAGWRAAVWLLVATSALLLPPTLLFLRDRPEDVGRRPYGAARAAARAEAAAPMRGTPLRAALRTRDYWLLLGSFFACGYTSSGLIGVHLIPRALEHGFTEIAAASAVGLMGMMNVVGTLGSGWASDRFDNRKLLAGYYGFRALSLAALPSILDQPSLYAFAIVFGLDYVATVPATANITASRFGRASLGTLFGWIVFSHQVGSAIASYAGGFFRMLLGDYHLIFLSAALLGFIAVALCLRISPAPRPVAVPA